MASKYAQGNKAFSDGSYEDAVALFSQALEEAKGDGQSPARAKAYDARSKAYEKLGKLKRAMEDAKQVTKLMPKSSQGLLREGMVYKASGLLEKSKLKLEAARALSSPPAFAEKITRAIAAVDQALAAQPTFRALTSTKPAKVVKAPAPAAAPAKPSAIAQLPVEIIWVIFELVSLSPAFPAPAQANKTMLSLRRVCQSWCNAVDTNPALWASLMLNITGDWGKTEKKIKLYVKRVLQDMDMGGGGSIRRLSVRRVDGQDSGSRNAKRALDLLVEEGALDDLTHFDCKWVGDNIQHKNEPRPPLWSFLSAVLIDSLPNVCRDTLQNLHLDVGQEFGMRFEAIAIAATFPRLRTIELLSGRKHSAAARQSIDLSYVVDYSDPTLSFAHLKRLVLVGLGTSGDSSVAGPSDASRMAWGEEFETVERVFPAVEELVSHSGLGSHVAVAMTDYCKLKTLDMRLHHDVQYTPDADIEKHALVLSPSLRSIVLRRPIPGIGPPLPRGVFKLAIERAMEDKIVFEHLTSFDLSGDLPPTLFDFLKPATMPVLRQLRLSGTANRFAGQPAVVVLAPGSLPEVKILDLSSCPWVVEDTIASLTLAAPQLERLNLRSNAQIKGTELMKLVRSRPPLPEWTETFSFLCSTNDKFNPPEIVHAKGKYSSLVELNVNDCPGIEAEAVAWLAKHIIPGGFTSKLKAETDTKHYRRIL